MNFISKGFVFLLTIDQKKKKKNWKSKALKFEVGERENSLEREKELKN